MHWNSSPDEIGHEYIIMRRIPGQALLKKWPEYSLEEKLAHIRKLAGYAAQLQRIRFRNIGGIYFDTPQMRLDVRFSFFKLTLRLPG